MFPITCSSIGDIIAVADLVLSIAKALKESTGAAQDYRDFVYELEALASVMGDVGRRAQESSDDKLRDALLDDVRHCCSDLERASQLTSGFDTLLRECALGAPGGSDIGDRVARGAKKLRWHFMKKAEAAEFAQRFHRWCSLIHLRITLLNDDASRYRAQEQKEHRETSTSLVRGDIALFSDLSSAHQRKVEDLLGNQTAQFRDQQQRAHADANANALLVRDDIAASSRLSTTHHHDLKRQYRVMDDTARHRASLLAGSLHELTRNVKWQSQIIQSVPLSLYHRSVYADMPLSR